MLLTLHISGVAGPMEVMPWRAGPIRSFLRGRGQGGANPGYFLWGVAAEALRRLQCLLMATAGTAGADIHLAQHPVMAVSGEGTLCLLSTPPSTLLPSSPFSSSSFILS